MMTRASGQPSNRWLATVGLISLFFAPTIALCQPTLEPNPTSKEASAARWTAQWIAGWKMIEDDYATKQGDPWDFDEGDNEGIDYLSPSMEDVKFQDGVMSFTTKDPNAYFFWGNWPGNKPEYGKENIRLRHFPSDIGAIRMRIRQSLPESNWEISFHLNGRQSGRTENFTVKGTDWTIVKRGIFYMEYADSVRLLTKEPNNEIEIDWIKAERILWEGYCRKLVELPSPAFRAVVDVAAGCDLFVNGKQAYKSRYDILVSGLVYTVASVDITRYLKPGENVLGLHGFRSNCDAPAFVYLQGAINCVTGEHIPLATDETWKCSDDLEKGWANLDFDDSQWRPAQLRTPYHRYGLPFQWPAYYGQVKIADEEEAARLQGTDKPVRFEVSIPTAYASQAYAMHYQIVNSLSGETAKQGRVSDFKTSETGLVYQLSYSEKAPGPYQLQLRFGEGTPRYLSRDFEFIVVGKIAQREVAGDKYEEGMELKLVETINCADPNDPHPFLDGGAGKSRIVVNRIGKYRATAPTKGEMGWFSYQINFQTLYQPHLIVMEYPDDAERNVLISLTPKRDKPYHWTQSAPGFITGLDFPLTNQMQQLRFIHWPSRSEATITVASLEPECDAAISRIWIYEIVNDLPATKINASNERFMGLQIERANLIWNSYHTGRNHEIFPSIFGRRYPGFYRDWYVTISNLIKHLKFRGENLYAPGCFQYWQCHYKSEVARHYSTPQTDFFDIMAQMFSYNDIAMVPEFEYQRNANMFYEKVTDEEMRKGAPTIYAVSKEGRQAVRLGDSRAGYAVNAIQPKVQQDILAIVGELADRYRKYPSFKGVFFLIHPIWGPVIGGRVDYYLPQVMDWGYGDYTIGKFEKDTKIRIPVDKTDPDRFAKRYDWIMAHAKEKWIQWRCDQFYQLQLKIRKVLRSDDGDLKLYNAFYMDCAPEWYAQGRQTHAYMREHGQDPEMYKGTPGLYWGRCFFQRARASKRGWNSDSWGTYREYSLSKDAISLYDRESDRLVYIMVHFREPLCYTDNKDWHWQTLKWCNYPIPAHQYSAEAYTRVLADSDPDTIIYGLCDATIFLGHAQNIRRFNRAFLTLPRGKFTALTGNGLDRNMAVRELKSNQGHYFYVANLGWWSTQVRIALSGEGNRIILKDLIEDKSLTLKGRTLELNLEPYQVRTFKVMSSGIRIQSATATVPKDVVNLIEQKVAQAKAIAPTVEEMTTIEDRDKLAFRKRLTEVERLWEEGKHAECYNAATSWPIISLQSKAETQKASRRWLIVGPFPNDMSKGFDTVYPVEREILSGELPKLDAKYQGLKGKSVSWQERETERLRGAHYFMDFGAAFNASDLDWAVAYAFTQVYSPQAQDAKLLIGSDDGIKVWLNGKLVLSKLVARGAQPGDDVVPVKLSKGWTRILVKVEEQIGGWGFFFDVADSQGTPLHNLRYGPEG